MTPTGLKPPPRHAPKRLRNTADLRALQRMMTLALVRPLARGDRLQPRWVDGRRMADVAAEFIKPNDRLTSVERLQIYNRMYWYRLLECMHDDNPGLRALLGERRFSRLAQAYLAKHPSRSFSLRNLCSRLPEFVADEPRWSAPRSAAARDVSRFEWAQTVAFDAEARPPLAPADFAAAAPERLRLGLQPYLTLLESGFAVDDFVVAVKKRDALRSEASNAVESRRAGRVRRVAPPRRGRVHIAVHRQENRLYYKRLERPAFLILSAVARGLPLARAISAGGGRLRPEKIQEWFALWTKLGWICKREAKSIQR